MRQPVTNTSRHIVLIRGASALQVNDTFLNNISYLQYSFFLIVFSLDRLSNTKYKNKIKYVVTKPTEIVGSKSKVFWTVRVSKFSCGERDKKDKF